MKRIPISLMLTGPILLLTLSCTNSPDLIKNLRGHYQNGHYTSAHGFFSVQLKPWVNLDTVKEISGGQSKVDQLSFQDKSGNYYRLRARRMEAEVDQEAAIDALVAKAKAAKHYAMKIKTPTGEWCYMRAGQRKPKDADQGYGFMHLIFYKHQVRFNLLVKTRSYASVQQAAEDTDHISSVLWWAMTFAGER